MKKILIVILFSAFSADLLFAQHGDPTGGSQPGATGIFIGKIADSTGKPVTGASVLLLQLNYDPASQVYKGKLLKGVATRTNGEFNFDNIPFNQPFQLKISAPGYIQKTQFISLKGGEGLKDFGVIKLVTDIKQLDEVTVRSSQGLLKMEADRLSYNVNKNIVTAGGTALDIMRYVPSIQTDIDGNVKLRNAAPQIFIDGRPTTLSLDQIPADAIETVEVITNPSAKYDASGGNAGILNLIMKKNRKAGYNGSLRAGIDRRGTPTGGAEFNLRQGKLNFSSSLNINKFKNFTSGTTEQFNAFENPHQQIYQDNLTKAYGGVTFGKIGLDYFANNKTTLSANLIKAAWRFKPDDYIYSSIQAGNVKTFTARVSNSRRAFNPTGLQFGLKHLFNKEGREITADATYFKSNFTVRTFFDTDSMNSSGAVYLNEQQKVITDGYNKTLTVQTDFTSPAGKFSKVESGLRFSKREFGNFNETFINRDQGGFISLPNAGSNYVNEDNVYAGYLVFYSSLKTLSYQLGLRGESSGYIGTVLSTNEKFTNSYALSLFPSAYFTKKLKNSQQLQLNFSRRINRPNFFNLIPFIDRTDPLNYSRGNAALKPEFTQSFNFNYNKIFKNKNSLLFSAYYKKTRDLITRYQVKEQDAVVGKEILINTYINASKATNYGFEITAATTVKKWWDVTTNINAYQSAIQAGVANAQAQESLLSWFGKINNSFKLPKSLTLQLSGIYQSKSILPVGTTSDGGHMAQSLTASQGYIKAFYAVDIAVRKSFLKNNAASVALSFTDIFKTRWQRQHSSNSFFIQDYSRLRDPQMVRVNFSYRFGKVDMSLFKRKNMKAEGEGMQGAAQGASN